MRTQKVRFSFGFVAIISSAWIGWSDYAAAQFTLNTLADLEARGINAGFEQPEQTHSDTAESAGSGLGDGWNFNLISGNASNFGRQDPDGDGADDGGGFFGPFIGTPPDTVLPSPFERRQIGFINLDGFSQAEIFSDPIGGLRAGETYTVNVAVGARNADAWADIAYRVGLRASDGTELGSFATATLNPGAANPNIQDLSYTLNASSVPDYVGDAVSIVIGGFNTNRTDGTDTTPFTQANFDNVRLMGTFDELAATLAAQITIDRATGNVTLSNPGAANVAFQGYSLTSEVGALDESNWTTITGNYDSAGGGPVDNDDAWTILSDPGSVADLSESELGGGDGGTLSTAAPVDLGNAWLKTPYEDVVGELLLNDGSTLPVSLAYIGTAIAPGDLDGNGAINVTDWLMFKNGQGTDLTGLSVAQAYQMGDLDQDLDHDLTDFSAFRMAFNAANGAGAFAAMVQSVPEANSLLLLLSGLILFGLSWSKRLRIGRVIMAAALLVSLASMVNSAHAELIARWTFEAGYTDDAGNGHDGTPYGNAMIAADADAERGMVLVLDDMADGTVVGSSHVYINDPAGRLDFGPDNPTGNQGSATIAAWLWSEGWTNHDQIFGQGEWNDGIGLAVKPDRLDADGNPRLWVGGDATSETILSNVGVPQDGTWNHVAAVYDFDGTDTTVAYYLNGVDIGACAAGSDGCGGAIDNPIPGRVNNPIDNMPVGAPDGIGDSRIGLEWRDTNEGNIRWAVAGRIDDLQIYDEALDADGIEAAMIGAIGAPVNLALNIDPSTGRTVLTNPTDGPISFNAIHITSESGSLDPSGYATIGRPGPGGGAVGDYNGDGVVGAADYTLFRDNLGGDGQLLLNRDPDNTSSISQDDYDSWKSQYGETGGGDSEFPQGNGSGNGWELGPNLSSNEIIEWYLTGNSTLDVSEELDLGTPFLIGSEQDLVFEYTRSDNSVRRGPITFEAIGAVGAGVPEPGSALLLLLAAGGLACRGSRRRRPAATSLATVSRNARAQRRIPTTAWLVALVGSLLVSSASADVTVDRLYLFGDNSAGGNTENGADGIEVGSGGGNISPGATIDHFGPSGSFQDLLAASNGGANPSYEDVSALGRPGAAPGSLGIVFDGLDDYLNGFPLGFPPISRGTINGGGSGTLNYDGVYQRGFQLWVYPHDGAEDSQHIVMDGREHGVRINDDGEWALSYANAEVSSDQPVDFNEWAHVMVVIPEVSQPYKSILYVNGLAIAARQANYSIDPANSGPEGQPLIVGASTGTTPGDSDFFRGVLDDLEMFVWGRGYNPQTDSFTNFGKFDLRTDNQFAAENLSLVFGDISNNGSIDQADVDTLVDGWLHAKFANGTRVGDIETYSHGDLNFDGITDLTDAGIMIGLLPAGSGAGLDTSGLVALMTIPEPSSLLVALVAIGAIVVGRCRQRPV